MKLLALSLLLCLLTPGGQAQSSGLPTGAASAPVSPSPSALPSPSSAVRGLWADGFGPGLKTPEQVSGLVQAAQQLHANVIFIQTLRRADCFCRRASVPVIADPDLAPGFDPLADVVTKAHAVGIKVIAWVAVTGIWNRTVPNPDPGQIMHLHGSGVSPAQDWLNHRADGSTLLGDDLFLDPANPQAAEFMVQEVRSVVKNYPVDGVQLDRIRYPDGGDWGYNPASLARYRAETGAKGTPKPTDPGWQDWKRTQVSLLERRLYLSVKQLRPTAWVSAATIVYGDGPADLSAFKTTRSYAEVLQNWPQWMSQGLLDLNIIMNYKTESKGQQAAWYDHWNSFASAQASSTASLVAAGSALYLNTPEASAQQAARALLSGVGWVGYAYRNPSVAVYQGAQDAGSGLAELVARLTLPGGPLTATPPFPAPPSVCALLGRVVGAAPLGGQPVELYQGSQLIARGVTDANGYYGFARLPAGAVEVRVGGQRWRQALGPGQVAQPPDLLIGLLRPVLSRPGGSPASQKP